MKAAAAAILALSLGLLLFARGAAAQNPFSDYELSVRLGPAFLPSDLEFDSALYPRPVRLSLGTPRYFEFAGAIKPWRRLRLEFAASLTAADVQRASARSRQELQDAYHAAVFEAARSAIFRTLSENSDENDAPRQTADNAQLEIDAEVFSAQGNYFSLAGQLAVYYDFFPDSSLFFAPYAGAGIGMAWNNLDDGAAAYAARARLTAPLPGVEAVSYTVPIQIPIHDAEVISLVISAQLGARINVSEGVDLDIGYEYRWLNEPLDDLSSSGLHHLRLGFTFSF